MTDFHSVEPHSLETQESKLQVEIQPVKPAQKSKDPLHGLTLETIVTRLVQLYGYPELHRFVPVRCFELDASIKSSLTFLRRTPWAREKVEAVYRDFGAEDWENSEFFGSDADPTP